MFEEGEASFAAQAAIIDDIREHNYLFSGYDHQEARYGAPVLNDGRIRNFTRRGFGELMAEAYGYDSLFNYSRFTDRFPVSEDRLPSERYVDGECEFMAPEELAEEFILEDGEYNFDEKTVITDDLDKLRYIDKGDTVTFGGRSYDVLDVDRRKDMTEKQREELLGRIFSSEHGSPEYTEALKIFDDTKYIVVITVGERV